MIRLEAIDKTISDNEFTAICAVRSHAIRTYKELKQYDSERMLNVLFNSSNTVMDMAENIGLISRQGMRASAFPVTPDEMKAAGAHYTAGALRHVFMQADRAFNILGQPASYTPRKTPLYNGKAEEGWKPLIP